MPWWTSASENVRLSSTTTGGSSPLMPTMSHAVHLALDLVALRLEQRLDRRVEGDLGLAGGGHGRRSAARERVVAACERVERLAAGPHLALRLLHDPRVHARRVLQCDHRSALAVVEDDPG